jgi:hypothetical protein
VQSLIDTDRVGVSELGASGASTVFLKRRRVPNWKVGEVIDQMIEELK